MFPRPLVMTPKARPSPVPSGAVRVIDGAVAKSAGGVTSREVKVTEIKVSLRTYRPWLMEQLVDKCRLPCPKGTVVLG